MSISYREAIESTDQKQKDALEKATAEHTKEVEKNIWRNLPSTKDFTQEVKAEIEQLQLSAESFALSGDNAKCAIAVVRAATLKKMLENYG